MPESLFQVSFHWCSGLTAGHRESSLHPQRPTPPSLTSGNFYSCHMLSQMTQLSLQLPSRHSAPSSRLASRPSPIFLSPAAPVIDANLFSTAGLISAPHSQTNWNLACIWALSVKIHLTVSAMSWVVLRLSTSQTPLISPSVQRWLVFIFSCVSGASPKIIKLQDVPSEYGDLSKGKSAAINSTLVPVKGINNLGNTCFFNAVMQVWCRYYHGRQLFFFSFPELQVHPCVQLHLMLFL